MAAINDSSVDGAELTSTNEAVVSAVQNDIFKSARVETVVCTHEGGEGVGWGAYRGTSRSSSERRGAGDCLRSTPYRARRCYTYRSTSANVGRILRVLS